MAETRTLVTAEQLLEMGDTHRLELVRGELVEMAPVGLEHVRLVGRLVGRIVSFVDDRRLGIAGPELGCVLSRNPDVVRAPDVAFISAGRLPSHPSTGYFQGAPDLAVEVLSPGDRAVEVQQELSEYLAAGARLVWIVDPQSKTVTAYQPSGDAHVYSGKKAVPGEPVLPGFSFLPADLFQS